MQMTLRPMTTGQVLDRTFNLYRRNFILFFGIALLPPFLVLLVQLLPGWPLSAFQAGMTPAPTMTPGQAGTFALAFYGLIAVWLIGFAPAAAATVFAVSAVHLGHSTSIVESYRKLRGRLWRMFNLVFSIIIRVIGMFILTIIAASAMTGLGAALGQSLGMAGTIISIALAVIMMVAAFVGTIYLFLRYAVAIPACAVEDIKARAALKRSVYLTKGDRGRIFVICFLVLVLQYIVSAALVFVPTFLAMRFASQTPFVFQAVNALASFLAGGLSGPIGTIALALVYYDERVRKEAFDLQFMMGSQERPAAATASAGTTTG